MKIPLISFATHFATITANWVPASPELQGGELLTANFKKNKH